jgi:hypothetical protein
MQKSTGAEAACSGHLAPILRVDLRGSARQLLKECKKAICPAYFNGEWVSELFTLSGFGTVYGKCIHRKAIVSKGS